MRRSLLAFVAISALAAGAPAAHAELKLCNRTSYVLYAATAFPAATDNLVQGWTRIDPGACRVAIKGDLTAPAYYVYARASSAHSGAPRAWSGNANFCAKGTDFSLRQPLLATQCPAPDMSRLPFAAITTHHMRSWTTTFRETPDFDSKKTAEDAGLKRLLGDIGWRLGARAAGSENAVALADFRKRMRLSDKASVADLFDALETEALKTAVAAGYAVCNDTDKPFWVALGQKMGGAWVARGWWMVAAGGCAKAITDSVASSKTYLRVEKTKNQALVAGPTKFCVTDIEFKIQGREDCAARGLIEAGFAETNLQGAPGFTAHVSADGLAASPASGSGTPK